MAKSTLKNPDRQVVKEQRVQEIIQYIRNTCPTVSGSDSPVVNSIFVDVRAYSGCHSGKDPKSRKIARKHIYIQKRLVDDWVKASTERTFWPDIGGFLLLTVFMKLCLIRGLIAAVKLAFASEDIDLKVQVHSSGGPCSLENFLSQWNGWLEFDKSMFSEGLPYHKRLRSIIFSDRISEIALGHVRITYENYSLYQLAAGDWTVFPPVCPIPYNLFHPHYQRMWDSQPMEDPNPTEIETMPSQGTSLMSYSSWVGRAKQVELEE
ncbi:hypothetical protein BD769DRAFT_1551800 [Suillus cothurnatus]|nr:hypothetical protein BD769DRAFT_1551800 [Suillus cothurnatus]